jgi:4-hydroxy-3-polyprenylbenzoate decarboxylase
MPREVPLHVGHCKLLYEAAQLGAIIAPPMPAFYSRPETIDDIVNHSIGRVLDLFDIEVDFLERWPGVDSRKSERARQGKSGASSLNADP